MWQCGVAVFCCSRQRKNWRKLCMVQWHVLWVGGRTRIFFLTTIKPQWKWPHGTLRLEAKKFTNIGGVDCSSFYWCQQNEKLLLDMPLGILCVLRNIFVWNNLRKIFLYETTIEPWQWPCGLLHWHWQKICIQAFCAFEDIFKNERTIICGVACHVGVVDLAKLLCCQQKRNFFWHVLHPRENDQTAIFCYGSKKETVVGLLVMLDEAWYMALAWKQNWSMVQNL